MFILDGNGVPLFEVADQRRPEIVQPVSARDAEDASRIVADDRDVLLSRVDLPVGAPGHSEVLSDASDHVPLHLLRIGEASCRIGQRDQEALAFLARAEVLRRPVPFGNVAEHDQHSLGRRVQAML